MEHLLDQQLIGARVRMLMALKGLSQRQLVKLTGVQPLRVNELYHGKISDGVSIFTIARIAEALGVSLSTLLDDDPMPDELVVVLTGRDKDVKFGLMGNSSPFRVYNVDPDTSKLPEVEPLGRMPSVEIKGIGDDPGSLIAYIPAPTGGAEQRDVHSDGFHGVKNKRVLPSQSRKCLPRRKHLRDSNPRTQDHKRKNKRRGDTA